MKMELGPLTCFPFFILWIRLCFVSHSSSVRRRVPRRNRVPMVHPEDRHPWRDDQLRQGTSHHGRELRRRKPHRLHLHPRCLRTLVRPRKCPGGVCVRDLQRGASGSSCPPDSSAVGLILKTPPPTSPTSPIHFLPPYSPSIFSSARLGGPTGGTCGTCPLHH